MVISKKILKIVGIIVTGLAIQLTANFALAGSAKLCVRNGSADGIMLCAGGSYINNDNGMNNGEGGGYCKNFGSVSLSKHTLDSTYFIPGQPILVYDWCGGYWGKYKYTWTPTNQNEYLRVTGACGTLSFRTFANGC